MKWENATWVEGSFNGQSDPNGDLSMALFMLFIYL